MHLYVYIYNQFSVLYIIVHTFLQTQQLLNIYIIFYFYFYIEYLQSSFRKALLVVSGFWLIFAVFYVSIKMVLVKHTMGTSLL